MYSHEMCLAVLSDRELRIRQVVERHLSALPASDVRASDRKTASVLQQKSTVAATRHSGCASCSCS